MSSAGRAASSSGCVGRPRGRETGLTGYAEPIRHSLPTGSSAMETAEHREPYESRVHVRIWERPEVRVLRATRQSYPLDDFHDVSAPLSTAAEPVHRSAPTKFSRKHWDGNFLGLCGI